MFKNLKFEILLGILVFIFIVFFSYFAIHRVYELRSYYYDLGIMDQVVYNTAQGRFLEMTNQDFGKNISRLAIHFDPILALLAPFYKIWEGPEILLIIQTIVLAFGAIATYLIAKHILKNKLYAFIFGLSYLFYFPVQRAVLFDFHAITFATTFLLFLIYFFLVKKYWLVMMFFFIVLLTKEHVGSVTFFLGLYFFVTKKSKKYSLILMILSIITVILTVKIIIPFFRQEEHFAVGYFTNFNQLFSQETVAYLKKITLSHGVFIVFAPITFLIALPELVMNSLSTNDNMRQIYFHYNSLIVAFVMYGSIVGFSKIKKFKNIFLIIFFVTNLTSIYYYNPLPFSFLKRPYFLANINSKKITFLKKWNKNLGNSEKVMTTPKIAPFFTARQFYYDFLFDPTYGNMGKSENDIIKKIDQYNLADWVIINKAEVRAGLPKKFYEKLVADSNFAKDEEEEGIEVYRKE